MEFSAIYLELRRLVVIDDSCKFLRLVSCQVGGDFGRRRLGLLKLSALGSMAQFVASSGGSRCVRTRPLAFELSAVGTLGCLP